MNTSLLTEEVILRGPNFFTNQTTLLFSPQNETIEWTLDLPNGTQRVIRPDIAFTKNRRMVLEHNGVQINTPEHFLVARFAHVVGLSINTSVWPPYHGRALEVLSALRRASQVKLHATFPKYATSKPVYFEYDKQRQGNRAFTSISPPEDERLTLKIVCKYAGLGEWERVYVLPDEKLLLKICSAHAQGWPPWLYPLSKWASGKGLLRGWWPHHRHITWVQEHSLEETQELFALHRAQDLLGALALLCRDGTFIGTVCSYYSGHKADIAAVKKADQFLVKM